MNISVLGSWNKNKSNWPVREPDQFIAACKAIGRGIVHGGHLLIVDEKATENSATWHAFRGVCDVLESSDARPPCVCLIDRNKSGSRYQKRLAPFHTAYIEKESNLRGREKRRAFQLFISDAFVFLGGASSTYNLGRAACARRSETTICIGSFGGAAEKLLKEELNNSPKERQRHLSLRAGPWNKYLENEVLHLLMMKKPANVLIIHGHGRDEYRLKDILQNELGLPEPIVLKDVRGTGLTTLPEKLELLGDEVHAAIALVTADDIGGLLENDGTALLNHRARQNVWLEVGWFWGRLGRDRVLLLCRGASEIPSDLAGVLYESYVDDLRDCKEGIAGFVRSILSPTGNQTPGSPRVKPAVMRKRA